MTRRGSVAVAGVVLVASTMFAAAPPAAAAGCTSPKLKIRYDTTRSRVHLKAWFHTNPGCKSRVLKLRGQIFCGDPVKKVYDRNTMGRAPLATQMKTLPSKKRCQRFVASVVINYYIGEDFDDRWTWKWGEYPA
ncbi:hypothetical protein ACWD26_30705 [Streptomyces sp. NPDC002787]